MAYPYDLIFNNKFVKFLKSYSSALTIQYEPAAVYQCLSHKEIREEKKFNVSVFNLYIFWKSTLL